MKDLDGEALKELMLSCSLLVGLVFNNCEFRTQFNQPTGYFNTLEEG